jgi:signal transduction histidine kinase/CheY-like chemotaxis protein
MSRRYDGYIIAVIATLTATMVRFAVAPLVGDRAHFFTYLIAVLVTARYGGFKPGVLAGFLGGLLGVYFFVPPPYSFRVADEGAVLVICLYYLIALSTSWFCGSLYVAQERSQARQRKLEAAEQALKASERRKDEFLATLAHELRGPLAPLQNAVNILRAAGGSQSDVIWCEGVIERQVQRLARLLDDLLDVSRIAFGKLDLCKMPVELTEVVENALEISRPAIDARGHMLHVAMPPESICIDADATRLAQVISNLLTNAAKFTGKGGHIWLSVERQGSDVFISVKDDGIGIGPADLPRIFDMFSQAVPAIHRPEGGLGIGLALVKGLVELHGGIIEARSDGLEKGSEFMIRMPIQLGASYGPKKPDALERAEVKRHILVADDNRDAADSLAKMLNLMGHEVHTAYDGQQAVEMAEALRPEIILLDIGMPKLNGYDAARRIRGMEWSQEPLLIALTGWGQEQDIRLAQEAGFDQHLLKPLEATALAAILDEMQPVGT